MTDLPLSHDGQSNLPSWWSRRLQAIEAEFDQLVRERLEGAAPILLQAKELARKTHERQAREGGGLYIIHPLRVAISLFRDLRLTDVTLIQAALLHDVIEDGGCTEESLSAQFGRGVAGLVAAFTPPAGEERPPPRGSPAAPH